MTLQEYRQFVLLWWCLPCKPKQIEIWYRKLLTHHLATSIWYTSMKEFQGPSPGFFSQTSNFLWLWLILPLFCKSLLHPELGHVVPTRLDYNWLRLHSRYSRVCLLCLSIKAETSLSVYYITKCLSALTKSKNKAFLLHLMKRKFEVSRDGRSLCTFIV